MIIEYVLIFLSIGISLTAMIIAFVYRVKYRLLESRVNVILKLKTGEAYSKTLRIRKRYIVFSIVSENDFTKRELENNIRRIMKEVYGETILVKADPQLIFYEPSVKRGVIRVAHLYKDQLIAVLGLLKNIDDKKLLIIPLKTTGTIKKAKRILYKARRQLQI